MMLFILQCIVSYHCITQGSIQLGLDGKRRWNKQVEKKSLYPKQSSFDMLVNIRKKITLLPIHVTFFWVDVHQFQRYWRQSYIWNINDKCDYLAKTFWQMKVGSNCLPNQLFYHSPWTISFRGKVAAYLNIQELYDHTYGNTE